MRYLPYLFPLLLLCSGCTKNVDSSDLKDEVPYYQGYEVAYNLTDNITQAAAWYSVRSAGGAKVELTNGANVQANNIAAGTSSIDKTRYTWTINGTPDVVFKLAKTSGVEIINTIRNTDIGTYNFNTDFPEVISKKDGFTFTWIGTWIGKTESMGVTINKAGASLLHKEITSSTITFSSADLQVLSSGSEVDIELYRVNDMELLKPDGGAGGTMQVRSYRSRTVMLKD